MNRLIFLLSAQLIGLLSFGQSNPSFHPPLKIPMYLSGNFGEIRADHFHSGIDIKTQGTTGHHIFSIEEGYVSRIKIQANGYGKSIYISHPGGHTSVYGHLERFREDIGKYVKRRQYEMRSHQLDIYVEPGLFQLEKGDFIAYSGNTGGSSGPHLHFEVRTTGNQHPTNVLKYGFDIRDERAPKFHGLFIYHRGNSGHVNGTRKSHSFELVIDNGIYTIPWGTRLEAGGDIGIGVEVYDYLNGVSNRCGVYTLELYIDEKLTYSQVMDEFSFSETRYVNAQVDYGELISSGRKIQKLFRLPNNKLRIYGPLVNDGILSISEARDYRVRVVATDVAGNRSELAFRIAGKPGLNAPPEAPAGNTVRMSHSEVNRFENDGVAVEIPAGALYEDLDFSFSMAAAEEEFLTDYYRIHNPGTPLHRPFTLSIDAPDVNPGLRDKLLLVTKEEGETVSAGGTFQDGAIVASLRNFGNYAIALDTVAPEIIPLNGAVSGDLSGRKKLSFTIRDDLAGIEKYEGYIDNRWALFEYDPKNELLTYLFDEEYLTKGQSHELELYISDSSGNVNMLHTKFNW